MPSLDPVIVFVCCVNAANVIFDCKMKILVYAMLTASATKARVSVINVYKAMKCKLQAPIDVIPKYFLGILCGLVTHSSDEASLIKFVSSLL